MNEYVSERQHSCTTANILSPPPVSFLSLFFLSVSLPVSLSAYLTVSIYLLVEVRTSPCVLD